MFVIECNSWHRTSTFIEVNTTFRFSGCHELIVQQKAQLLSDPEQLVEALGWKLPDSKTGPQKKLFVMLTDEEKKIAELLWQNSKMKLDEIALAIGGKVSSTAALLMQMEMKGVIRALPGKLFERI